MESFWVGSGGSQNLISQGCKCNTLGLISELGIVSVLELSVLASLVASVWSHAL